MVAYNNPNYSPITNLIGFWLLAFGCSFAAYIFGGWEGVYATLALFIWVALGFIQRAIVAGPVGFMLLAFWTIIYIYGAGILSAMLFGEEFMVSWVETAKSFLRWLEANPLWHVYLCLIVAAIGGVIWFVAGILFGFKSE